MKVIQVILLWFMGERGFSPSYTCINYWGIVPWLPTESIFMHLVRYREFASFRISSNNFTRTVAVLRSSSVHGNLAFEGPNCVLCTRSKHIHIIFLMSCFQCVIVFPVLRSRVLKQCKKTTAFPCLPFAFPFNWKRLNAGYENLGYSSLSSCGKKCRKTMRITAY